MARSGSLAAWEQRLANQRREDDRQARLKKQAERDAERIRQQDHLASRQQEAEHEKEKSRGDCQYPGRQPAPGRFMQRR